METNKIAFILCVNDMSYYEECAQYIQNLHVPEGYTTDLLCIQEAESMAQGYNAGMQATDARYKVYLHQDTFIVNKNFLCDLLDLFRSDEKIGMVGVMGGKQLPDNADCCLKWDTGAALAYDGIKTLDLRYGQQTDSLYFPVQAIDGLLMATQVDLPWREDFLDGWDFYDVSQSLEMLRHGYQVVIPQQRTPWCHHDCGASKLARYDHYRQRIIREYPEFFREESGDIASIREKEIQTQIQETTRIRMALIQLLEAGLYEELGSLAAKIQLPLIQDTTVREIVALMEIYVSEKACGNFSHWWNLKTWEEMAALYRYARFILLRARYQLSWEKELNELLIGKTVTQEAIGIISRKMFGQS